MSLCLAVAMVFGLEGLCVTGPENPGCERYVRAFQTPGVADELKSWYLAQPKKWTRQELKRIEIPGFGYRRHAVPLNIDPSLIGLGARAHAEFNLNINGEIQDLLITDEPRYAFMFKDETNTKAFEWLTQPSARNDLVGVNCLKPD